MNAHECLRVNIDTTDADFQINVPQEFGTRFFHSITPIKLDFSLSFNNISAEFGNNILNLNNGGTQFIILADGCYDIDDLNTYHLNNALFGLFFKIQPRFDGQGYGLYSYTSSANRSSYVSGILITNSSSLNGELQWGKF